MKIAQLFVIIDKIKQQPQNQGHKDELLAVLYGMDETSLNRIVTISGQGLFSPLMYAAFIDCEDAVAMMLRFTHVIRVQHKTTAGYTALDWAIFKMTTSGSAGNVIKWLRKAGARTGNELARTESSAQAAELAVQTFVLDPQNTHDPVLVESVCNAMQALASKYNIDNQAKILEEINAYIALAYENQPEFTQALQNFLDHKFMQFKYPNSSYTLQQLLCLVWLAIHDQSVFANNAEDRAEREHSLFLRMIDAQRGVYGACAEGRCHALIECLDRVVDEVKLCYGNGAVKDILFMRFKQLFKEQLLSQENFKALVLAAEYSDDEPQAQIYQDFFNQVKPQIITQLNNEFPQAFRNGTIETATVDANGQQVVTPPRTWFQQHLKADDVPLEIAEYAAIRDLQRFHNWICKLSQQSTAADQQLIDLINTKMSAADTDNFAACYQIIYQTAATIFPQIGWLQRIATDKKIAYFNNLSALIEQLPATIKAQIAAIWKLIESADEAALKPILALAFNYLLEVKRPGSDENIFAFLPTERNQQFAIFKQALAHTSAFMTSAFMRSDANYSISPEFIRQCKLYKLQIKISLKLHTNNWLTTTQIQALEDELQTKSESEQDEFIQHLLCFYKILHYPEVVRATTTQEFINQVIARPQILQNSALLQHLLLDDHHQDGTNFLHVIAEYSNSDFFAILSGIYAKNRNFNTQLRQTITNLNWRGLDAIAIACKTNNQVFLDFIYSLELSSSKVTESLMGLLLNAVNTDSYSDLFATIKSPIINPTKLANVFISSAANMLKYNNQDCMLAMLVYLQQKSPQLLAYFNPGLNKLQFTDHNLTVVNWLLDNLPQATLSKEMLTNAVNNYDFNIVYLIFSGKYVEPTDPCIQQAMLDAAGSGYDNIINALLQIHPDKKSLLTFNDRLRQNSLHRAASICSPTTVKLLINAWPDTDKFDFLMRTTLLSTTALQFAVKNYDLITADIILAACNSSAQKMQLLLQTSLSNDTPLQVAARNGMLNMIDLILDSCETKEQASTLITFGYNKSSHSALYNAVKHNLTICALTLLERLDGDDFIKLINEYDNNDGLGIINLAATDADGSLLLAILAKFTDPQLKMKYLKQKIGYKGIAPLHTLVNHGHLGLLRTVLASLPHATAKTLLHEAKAVHKPNQAETYPRYLEVLEQTITEIFVVNAKQPVADTAAKVNIELIITDADAEDNFEQPITDTNAAAVNTEQQIANIRTTNERTARVIDANQTPAINVNNNKLQPISDIQQILQLTGIKISYLTSPGLENINAYNLKRFIPNNQLQAHTQKFLIEILKIEKKHGPQPETEDSVADMLQLLKQPQAVMARRNCISSLRALTQRSWGQKAAIAALALVGVILIVAAAVTVVPTGGLSIGLLVAAASSFATSGVVYKLTPSYKRLGKLGQNVVTEINPSNYPDAFKKPRAELS